MDLKQIDLDGKRVFVRVDFNVPLDADHNIIDDTRIRRALPTIKYLIKKGASLVIASHLGRPQKKLKEDGTIDKERFTMRHLVGHLRDLTGAKVIFTGDSVGGETELAAERLLPGQILLLENTRFYKEESAGDVDYAIRLSRLADVYVNDAFGTAHRAHASTATIAQYFTPEHKAFGLLMMAEIMNANKVLKNPARPYTAVIGGAKVSDKIQLLDRLIEVVNEIIIGGGMAYTFFKAQGGKIGNSLCEDEHLELAVKLLEKAKRSNVDIWLPEDSVVANGFSNDAEIKLADSDKIEDGWMGLDIGPKSIKRFESRIAGSKTIFWNGPMGVFEMSNFSKGTFSVAKAISKATQNGAFSLVGGGDSVAAINQANLSQNISYVSTGGGAMVEFLEGKKLPGIAAILD